MALKSCVVFACLITALSLGGCSQPAARLEPVRPVRAFKAGDLKALATREFPGRARAKDEVDLSFQVSGPLVSLPVDVGSEVNQGDVVAAIDPRDFQAALDSADGNLARAQANLAAMEKGARPEEIEQLKASLAEAEASYAQAYADHQRNANLLPSGAVTQREFDITLARAQATAARVARAKEDLNIGMVGAREEDLAAKRAEIKALEATVANARNQLEYATLKAPFAGRVAARYVDNFQTVQSKEPIVRLLDISRIEVTIQVPESLIALVPKVQQASCRFDAIPDREFLGEVTKIGSEASRTTRTYPVTIQLPQPEDVQILPGMAATVRGQPAESAETLAQDLVLPPGAVFTDQDGRQSYVWVVDEGSKKVARRAVKTGAPTPVGLAVTEGIKPGEWIVSAGVNSLVEDQEVRILQEGNR